MFVLDMQEASKPEKLFTFCFWTKSLTPQELWFPKESDLALRYQDFDVDKVKGKVVGSRVRLESKGARRMACSFLNLP